MFLRLLGAGDKTQGKDSHECTSGLLVIPRSPAQLGLLDAEEHRRSSMEDHRKAEGSPTRAILAVVIKAPADRSSGPKGVKRVRVGRREEAGLR